MRATSELFVNPLMLYDLIRSTIEWEKRAFATKLFPIANNPREPRAHCGKVYDPHDRRNDPSGPMSRMPAHSVSASYRLATPPAQTGRAAASRQSSRSAAAARRGAQAARRPAAIVA